jgi:pantetheine-phosphate adenylyltransferase
VNSLKTAICPGSFDPVTLGHIDIIARAAKMFDKLVVAVLDNSSKQPSFTLDERVSLIKKATVGINNIEITSFSGLLVDFAKKIDASVIVKGLRAVSDFEYEFQMALINRELYPEIDTVFLTTDSKYMYLSSSVVKEIARYNGDIKTFIPSQIYEEVANRLNGGTK